MSIERTIKEAIAAGDFKSSKRQLRYQFSNDEVLQLGKDLADKANELQSTSEDSKRSAADWKSRLSALSGDIDLLANKVRTGYEIRMVECCEYLGVPVADRKTIVRTDTMEIVAVEELSANELPTRIDR